MATLTLPSPFKHLSSPPPYGTDPRQKIVDKAEALATYFIPYHLRRAVEHHKLQGLPKHYLIPPQHPSPLCTFVADICTTLGEENADFFDNLPDSMNLRQHNARDVYMSVCRSVFADGVVNWGRVMSLLTLAATFAVHFTLRGELCVVVKIPCWLGEVVDELLAEWIHKQGGWEDVQRSLSTKNERSNNWSKVFAYGAMMATAGLLLFSIRKGNFL